MKFIFTDPYVPETREMRKDEGTRSSQTPRLCGIGIKRPAVTQPAASSGTKFSFVKETYPFNKAKDQDKSLRQPDKVDARELSNLHHLMASGQYSRQDLSTCDSPPDSSYNGHQTSTLTCPVAVMAIEDTSQFSPGLSDPSIQLTSVVGRDDAPPLPSTAERSPSLPQPVLPEIECVDIRENHYRDREETAKHTIDTISPLSSDIASAHECRKAEKGDHPATPCLARSTCSPAPAIESGVTTDDTTEPCLTQEDRVHASGIEVLPLGPLEWEVEQITGEETVYKVNSP